MIDSIGDRMKAYEAHETGRLFLPMLPIYARIDGRGFSRFTKGMDKPHDLKMSEAMIETTKYLVKHTHAKIGYVQSDEISLVWYAEDYTSKVFFDGKVTKMTSVLAAMATAAFNHAIRGWAPYEDRYPGFDARVVQLPHAYEAANMFLWRTKDCERNSVSMLAQQHFSSKSLHGVNRQGKMDMLADIGVAYHAMPEAFTRGTWIGRRIFQRPVTAEEAGKHPDNEGAIITRAVIEPISMPAFTDVANRTEVIFQGAAPVLNERQERP